jgi:hypothetical protein
MTRGSVRILIYLGIINESLMYVSVRVLLYVLTFVYIYVFSMFTGRADSAT